MWPAMQGLRKTAVVLLAIAAVVFGLLLVVRALLNPERYRPALVSYLEEKTGKQVEIGGLSLTWFPMLVRVDDFGVRNGPPFPSGYVVKVAHIDAELDSR